MTDTDPAQPAFILNPRTNRKLKIGTKSYDKFIEAEKKAQLEADNARLADENSRLARVNTPPIEPAKPIKAKLAKMAVGLVAKNKSKFSDLSSKETDKLLRTLLIAKLTTTDKKKKKKKKKKIITPPSSSSEESSSESDSD
jgi:hypothetical protein